MMVIGDEVLRNCIFAGFKNEKDICAYIDFGVSL